MASFLFAVYQELYFYYKEPASKNAVPQMVLIGSGQSFASVTQILHEKKIIHDPVKFKLIARVMGFDRSVKAGEYLLSASMPPEILLETLVEGKVYLYRVTIPEGFTLSQIAALLDEQGLVNGTEFLKIANDSDFIERLGIRAENLEGYLFPDTYFFSKDVSAGKMLSVMAKRFQSIFHPMWENRPSDLPFSIHEIVTLASIIEKETGIEEERPLVSSVFHNRLKKNMRLQSDPTVIYGLENFDGNLTRDHLTTPTPYNTYTSNGLPPGPIANPGKASLEAALFPLKTQYLYFVSKKDKTHFFSTTYDDHREAVKKYQLNK